MKNNKLLYTLLLITCILPLWSSIKDYQSAKIQYKVLGEINSKSNLLTRENYELLKKQDKSYPNLTITALPMYSIEAFYDISFGDYKSALYNTIRAKSINPYIMFNESLMSDIYKKIGLKDSAQYYARMAFKNLPGNEKHFMQYANLLIEENQMDELISVYFSSDFKTKDIFKKVFLSGVVGKSIKNTKVDSLALSLIDSQNLELKILAYYYLNGIENTKKAIELSKEGLKSFIKKDYENADSLYLEAINLNSYDVSNYQNLGLVKLNLKEYSKAIDNFKIIIDSFNLKNDKSYYLIGVSHLKNGDTIMACNNLLEANKLGNKNSIMLYKKLCF